MGSNPTRPDDNFGKQFVVDNFKQWLYGKKFVKDYETTLINKISLIYPKQLYNSEIIHTFISKMELINSNKNCNRLVKLLLHYLEIEEILSYEQILEIKRKIKNIKEGVDNHVPTDNEVQQTLVQLSDEVKVVYLMYLVSGIRKIEGSYLLINIDKLKTQEMDGFVKITMNYLRHNKNSYFCYLPIEIYNQLKTNNNQLSLTNLEYELKTKHLIHIKYCRKWFYTKCIELSIPESIADYYQGRVANSVGSNHYLSRQLLADQNYSKIVSYLKSFNP